MRTRPIPAALLPLAAAGLLLAAAPAQADTLETPVTGGAHLAAGGGWHVWSAARPDGTHRLQVRRPDGTVVTPRIRAFRAPVDASIGTRGGADGINTQASRRISAVYARCAGTSTTAGCDVQALNLTTLREERVPALATARWSETAPSVDGGRWAFARRGPAAGRGTWSWSEQRGILRRLTPTVARETAASPNRAILTYGTRAGFGVQLRPFSGRRGVVLASGLDVAPTSPQVTRYRAGWLLPDTDATRVFLTARFAGSGGPYVIRVTEAERTLPAGVRWASGDQSRQFLRYLDAAGITRIDPPIR